MLSESFLEILLSVKTERGDIYKELISILNIYFSSEKDSFK